MPMRLASIVVLLLATSSCYRSHERASPGDAGAPDARGPIETGIDAPPVDGGSVERCDELVGEPGRVASLEHVHGPFEQPDIAPRADGAFDLIARRVGATPLVNDVWTRRARLQPDGRITHDGPQRRLLGPSTANQASTLREVLGTCSNGGIPTDPSELRTWDGDNHEIGTPTPLGSLTCEEMVGGADRWLLFTRGIGETTEVTERALDGRVLRGPSPAFDPPSAGDARATSLDDGFAWVGVDADGRTQVVFRGADGTDTREALDVAPSGGRARPTIGPGIAAGTVAVAFYEGTDLFVSVVERGRGEIGRSGVLASSAVPDVDPVVLLYRGRLVVLSLEYALADAVDGWLTVRLLDERFNRIDAHRERTRRERTLTYDGVAGAVVGDALVVHWVGDSSTPPEPERAGTAVLAFRCGER